MLTCIFGQRAPYSILSSMYKKTTSAGNTQEKKIECDYHFQRFNYNISKPVTQHYHDMDYFI